MDNEVDSDVSNLDERFKHLQKLLNHFWKRWSNEYLVSLRRSHLGKGTGRQHPQVGDVVVVHDDNLRRQLWRIGKIVKLLTSKDGKKKLNGNGKTAKLRRPMNRLYLFEHGRSEEITETSKPAIKFVDNRNIVTFLTVAAGQ